MAEKINFSDKSRNVRAIFSKDGSASFVEISDFQESSIGAFCSAGISPGRQGVLYAELPDGNRHAAEVTSCEELPAAEPHGYPYRVGIRLLA